MSEKPPVAQVDIAIRSLCQAADYARDVAVDLEEDGLGGVKQHEQAEALDAVAKWLEALK